MVSRYPLFLAGSLSRTGHSTSVKLVREVALPDSSNVSFLKLRASKISQIKREALSNQRLSLYLLAVEHAVSPLKAIALSGPVTILPLAAFFEPCMPRVPIRVRGMRLCPSDQTGSASLNQGLLPRAGSAWRPRSANRLHVRTR